VQKDFEAYERKATYLKEKAAKTVGTTKKNADAVTPPAFAICTNIATRLKSMRPVSTSLVYTSDVRHARSARSIRLVPLWTTHRCDDNTA